MAAASTDWFGDVYLGDSAFGSSTFHHGEALRGPTVLDLNFSAPDEPVDLGARTFLHANVGDEDEDDEEYEIGDEDEDEDGEDEDEDDYENEVEDVSGSDDGSAEEAEEEAEEQQQRASNRSTNMALFAEWAAWIHEEGGMHKLLSLMYPSPHENQPSSVINEDVMSNWIVPMVPLRPTDSLLLREDNLIFDGLRNGAMYDSKEELIIAAGLWHLERRMEFRAEKSDTERMLLKCKHHPDTCTFKLSAKGQPGGVWVIRSFRGVHTCVDEGLTTVVRRKARSKVIGAYFAKRILRDAAIMKPKVIANELKELFGVDIKYGVALRGRNCAVEMIYGKYGDSFSLLPGYLHILERTNPDTVTALDVDEEGRFKHVFVALGATRRAYQNCMRPVIVVDGTHLKGKNNGVLLVAVTKDANEQLYPLAYGVGPIENHES